ncbi:MAG: twin transmembrane helix small protein [Pseudomonadota bacterium]
MSITTIVITACLAVLAVLILGINAFRRGGEYNRSNANRLMRWRLGLQALAVVIILVAIYIRRETGG